MQTSESAAVNPSWLSSLITEYLRWRTKCLLFLLHRDPTRSQAKQGQFRPAFGYSPAALELAALRPKWVRTPLPARLLHAVGVHKVLGARRCPYQHLQPPLWQLHQLFTSPVCSKKVLRSTALPSDLRLLSSNSSHPCFLTQGIWVAPDCVFRAQPCWKPWDEPAGFTRSSGDLSPMEQREKNRKSLITALTFTLFPLHILE